MEPTYRIDLIHRPEKTDFPWRSSITRLADDNMLEVFVGDSPQSVTDQAREHIVKLSLPVEHRQPVYMDENGKLTGAPNTGSVKA